MQKQEVFFILCLFFCFYVQGQEGKQSKLLPDHVKLQFAGGSGFLSIGIGYESRGQKTETDLYYGYVPKSIGGTAIHAITGKFTWHPLKSINRQQIQIRPLSVGLLANYTMGKQYFFLNPDNYPYNYYGYPTALHFGTFLGGQIKKNFKEKRFKAIGVYYEIGTSDFEVVSILTNTQALRLTDILNLGVGIKTSF